MISAILIYGKRGEILSSRIYKDGLRRAVTDVFRAQVISNAGNSPVSPVLTLGSTSFLHIRHNGLFVVAVTRHDVDGIAVLEFLYKICEVCTSELGQFDEAACYRYVCEIYAILDELADFGFPQNTNTGTMNLPSIEAGENRTLQPSGVVTSLKRSLTIGGGQTTKPPSNEGSEVPWRRANVKHRRNEVYLDVIEKLNAVFDPNGHVLSASTDGVLKVKAALTGLPRCQVDFERSEILENSQLHACVDHQQFHATGAVQFVPPEGEFELLRYRVSRGIRVPIQISTVFGGGEQIVKLRNTLADRPLTNVVVLLPMPPSATSSSHRIKSSSGKAKFSGEKTAVEWKIGRLGSNGDATLRVGSNVPIAEGNVSLKFQIDMYTCTQVKVSALQVVESSKYSTLKWVRYLTESGAVEMRM